MGIKSSKIYSNSGDNLSGLILVEPEIFRNNRGFFSESWNKKEWYKILDSQNQNKFDFVQDNHSRSSKGVLRGLHFQTNPVPQGKLVRCILIYDVVVDIRKESKTFVMGWSIFIIKINLNYGFHLDLLMDSYF